MPHYVYILRLQNNRLYVGSTNSFASPPFLHAVFGNFGGTDCVLPFLAAPRFGTLHGPAGR